METRKHDYIPRNPALFNDFMKNLLHFFSLRKGAWEHIPEEPVQNLSELFEAFQEKHSAAQGLHTPLETAERQKAQADCIKALRPFVNQYLRFPPVTDADRIAMGIPNHDTILTHHDVVNERVEIRLENKDSREIKAHFRVNGATNKAKPFGYAGAVFQWDVLDKPPERPQDLKRHRRASRTPFTMIFDETERGKTVYVTAAWENGKSILGEFCEVISTIVP